MNLAPAVSRDSDLEEERQGVQIDAFSERREHPGGVAADVSEWKAVRGRRGRWGKGRDKDKCSPVGQQDNRGFSGAWCWSRVPPQSRVQIRPTQLLWLPPPASRLPRISHPSCTLFSHDRLSSLYLTTYALRFERHHQSSQLGQFP